jgi:hypothetical protein
MIDIEYEAARLRGLGTHDLQREFAERMGTPCRSGNRDYIISRLLWQAQATESGSLSDRVRALADNVSKGRGLRTQPPRDVQAVINAAIRAQKLGAASATPESDGPAVGDCIERLYKNRLIQVRVLQDGFEWEGTRYRSLTSVAKAVTGTNWNGWHFFGLRQGGKGGR